MKQTMQKQSMQPISIIVPTLNEADNIALLFKRIHASMTSVGLSYEIIVVDDNSTDETANLVRKAHHKYHARLLTKQGKPGKAFSLLEGFQEAQYELICMIDADLQYPPEAIKLMYHKLQYCEADIVLTERIENKTSALRRLSSATFNLVFTRALFGIHYDTQSGLKLFRKSVLNTLSINPSPWTFDLEFIVKALEQNYVIVSQQIPFSMRNAGVAKLHIVSATAEIASGSLKLWRNTSIKQVRSAYKRSQFLQRSAYGMLAVVASVAVLTAVPVARTSAMAGDVPPAKPIFTPVQIVPIMPTPSDAQALPPIASQSLPVTPTQVQLTPAQTASSAPTAQFVTNQPIAPSNSPQAQYNTTPTRNDAFNPQTSSKNTNSVKPASAITTSFTTPSNPPIIAQPFTLKTATGKNAAYYPPSSLGKTRTDNLRRVALNTLKAGALFIVVGSVVLSTKLLAARMRHQPIRA